MLSKNQLFIFPTLCAAAMPAAWGQSANQHIQSASQHIQSDARHIQSATRPLQTSSQQIPSRPNILWLSYEDSSSSEYGCYGNEQVHTPNIDSLAAKGIMFRNAWSCAPQSSPSRSGIITGCYATTYGMDLHPVSFDTPDGIFFPRYLREAGYYCTNNSKTHYNTTRDNKAIWDECSKNASYKSPKRGENQPFFAVFNSVTSHMARARSFTTDGRRDYSLEGIDTAALVIPPYVPDTPQTRSDYAAHLESIQDIDKWLGIFIDDLEKNGLSDDTIIFFFSDHGGCLPRGKGYLYESGLRVPMIAYFPEKWRHLAAGFQCGKTGSQCETTSFQCNKTGPQCETTGIKSSNAGRNVDKAGPNGNIADLKCTEDALVNFTDLAPTMLSIAGIEPPKSMQGKAIFGKYASKKPREYNIAYAANHLHHFTPARAISDGHFKLLRTYLPYRQFALRNYYQWGMPANQAWDRMILEGKNTNPAWALPFSAHPAEMLFNLDEDPSEINDLSSDPAYAKQLKRLRKALAKHVRQTKDLGFFLPETRAEHNLYEWVRESHFPLRKLQRLAALSGTACAKDSRKLEKQLSSDIAEMRFWAAAGFAHLAQSGQISECPQALLRLLDDSNDHVACEAAIAVSYLSHAAQAVKSLIEPSRERETKICYSALECLSLDAQMHPYIMEYLEQLQYAAENLPMKENEDAGLMARGILVNLHQMDISLMYGPDAYQRGLKLNKGRRPIAPLP